MLDSYTSTMCLKSWGRNSYSRALVKVSSKEALLDSLVVAITTRMGSIIHWIKLISNMIGSCQDAILVKFFLSQ